MTGININPSSHHPLLKTKNHCEKNKNLFCFSDWSYRKRKSHFEGLRAVKHPPVFNRVNGNADVFAFQLNKKTMFHCLFILFMTRRTLKTEYLGTPVYKTKLCEHILVFTIGDLPVGAGVALATPDKERNLFTRNQNVINKELFGKRSGRNKYFFKWLIAFFKY